MNKKVKTVITFGLGFFGGMCALGAIQNWLCENGEAYIYFKEGGNEFGDRKIVPPASGRYHWNSDKEGETSE